ncbi:MAG: rhamnan synthesis F family protein [Chthoniobacterales bacterium]
MNQDDIPDLEWTGERYVPQVRGSIALEHLHRYAMASEFVQGKYVLDVACGEGYGSNMLARKAASVIGVDIDEKTIIHAQKKYRRSNLFFKQGSCTELPLSNHSIDIVVSFETIEHIAEHEKMLSEIKRVLKPGGILIISSPEKHEYTEVLNQHNQFHVRELYLNEFEAVLKRFFKHHKLLGQRMIYGSGIFEENEVVSFGGSYDFESLLHNDFKKVKKSNPQYLIAICSDQKLSKVDSSLCEQSISENIFWQESAKKTTGNEPALPDLNKKNRASRLFLKIIKKIDALAAKLELEKLSLGKKANTFLKSFSCNDLPENKLELEAVIKPSIFNEDWYLCKYLDVLESGMAPFTHYITHGWKEFRNPHWLFDTKFFLEKYPEIHEQKLDPFTYYCVEGWKKKMQPHPTFDVHWYTEKNPGALDQNPLIHYITEGWKDGSSPYPLFFSSWYLRKYPDLPKDYNPFFHYLNFGKAEGRLPNAFNKSLDKIERNGFDPSAELLSQVQQYEKGKIDSFLKSFHENKETILLVSHEASRTGAPVLVYNLALSLKEKYNVIILTLEGGCLLSDFQTVCNLLIGPLTPQQKNDAFLYLFFKEINKKVNIKYAIVNSIVSSSVLLPLFENRIVILHLIHEFSSYTRPPGLFLNSAFLSAKQVYSADLVRENAVKDAPQLNFFSSITLPQGICRVPDLGDYSEEIKIKDILKEKGWTEDVIVVLGVGTVSLRKGVDLFISCAKRVLELGPQKKFKFIWIGEGFNPELDGIYSVYLADQIERSGLREIVNIIEPIKNINSAYLLSEILFLSSRLDPLPLVALDALNHQKALICFESATGIAEYLLKDPDAAFGVIPYLNTEIAAQKIYQLIEDEGLRSRIGCAGKKIALSTFNFQKYVETIDQIALECIKDKKQELEDEIILKKSNLFNIDFMIAPHAQLPCVDIAKWYLKNEKVGFQLRKPFPGFHPGLYAESHQLQGRNALAHYISNGFPSGPWKIKIINNTPSKSLTKVSLPTALHIHLYYPEMASEILHRLRGINYQVDLLISVTSHEAAIIATEIFSKYKNGTILIKEFPNRGRNFGPLLTGFREIILEKYQVIGHIHTKKSVDMGEKGIMDSMLWTHFLYSNLLGGFYNMANIILEEFQNNSQLGLVFPDDPNIVTWGKNQSFAKELIRKMKINCSLLQEHLNFPIGSMFWARTEALRPLFELNFHWEDYPEEPLPYDGSMLHAIERLLPLIVQHAHYQSASTYLEGVVR